MRHGKFILIIFVLGVVFLSGCVREDRATLPQASGFTEEIIGTEVIGGKYNLTVIDVVVSANGTTYNMKKIRYVKDGKVVEPDMMLSDEIVGGLNWIKENTDDDAVVLSWWDHGHMIRGYAEREVVLDAPSREILATTVSKYIGKPKDDIVCDDCTAHGKIMDVARAFTEYDSEILRKVMEKYGASVFYVQTADKDKSHAFYVSYGGEPVDPLSIGFMRTNIGRALNGEVIEGFELAYSDDAARVYKMKPVS
ncbi:MAG: hypothetical protein ABIG84_05110 [archaeon]